MNSPAVQTKSTFVDSPVHEGGLRLYSPPFQWRVSSLVSVNSSTFINGGGAPTRRSPARALGARSSVIPARALWSAPPRAHQPAGLRAAGIEDGHRQLRGD